jgi:uncharacterized membrane protein YdjX (TVP38/TMEM64 family)
LAALVLIPIPLVWLAIVGIPANSPLSPILPTAFDPLIIEIGKYAPAFTVTCVATGTYMYTEFLNWYIYVWVLHWERLDRLRENRWVGWGVDRFATAPITTIIFFAATPLPFWVARSLAILHRYPLKRFMLATAAGRFPRFFVYAWLGSALSIPTYLIIAVIVLGGMVAIGVRIARGQAILEDVVIDRALEPNNRASPALSEDSSA